MKKMTQRQLSEKQDREFDEILDKLTARIFDLVLWYPKQDISIYRGSKIAGKKHLPVSPLFAFKSEEEIQDKKWVITLRWEALGGTKEDFRKKIKNSLGGHSILNPYFCDPAGFERWIKREISQALENTEPGKYFLKLKHNYFQLSEYSHTSLNEKNICKLALQDDTDIERIPEQVWKRHKDEIITHIIDS